MGGCSGQTKQACEVLGKALSLEPGSRAAAGAGVLLRTPAPLPCLPGRGEPGPNPGCSERTRCPPLHTSTAPAGLHLTSAGTLGLRGAAGSSVPFLQMSGEV